MRNDIEGKNKGQACFIDLQKAFDILDHEILMIKLEKWLQRNNFKYTPEVLPVTGINLYVKTEIIPICSVLKLAFPRVV